MTTADDDLTSAFAPPRSGRRSADPAPLLRPRRVPAPMPPGHPAEAEVQRYYLCCEEPSGDFVEVIVAVSDGGRRRYFATSDGAAFAEVDDDAFARRSEDGARSLLELDAREIDELEAELGFVRAVRGRDPLAELAAAEFAAAPPRRSSSDEGAYRDHSDADLADPDLAAPDLEGLDDLDSLAALLPRDSGELGGFGAGSELADSVIPAWLAEYVEATQTGSLAIVAPAPEEAEAEPESQPEPEPNGAVASPDPADEQPTDEQPADEQPVDAVSGVATPVTENGPGEPDELALDAEASGGAPEDTPDDATPETEDTVMDEFEAMVMGLTAPQTAPAPQAAATPHAAATPQAAPAPAPLPVSGGAAEASGAVDGAAQVALAKGIAFVAHRGQLDRTGAEYIDHPGRVAEQFDAAGEPVATAAAWLHDVLEDSAVTAQDLLEAGVLPEVVEAVVVLTRTDDVAEGEYYARISRNETARRVKLADVADNAAPWRLRKLDFETQARLAEKYRHAREALGA